MAATADGNNSKPLENILAKPQRLACGQVIPNRLCKAASSEHLGHQRTGEPLPELCTLYSRWASGGSGLVITGNVMVDERYLEGCGNVVAKRQSEAWSAWGAASHARDGPGTPPVVIVQLGHPGRQCPMSVLGLKRPVAPSEVSFKLPGVGLQLFRSPRALEEQEVEDVIKKFADAAAIVCDSGFDGVQIHGAHGYLLSSFLSPHTNRRTDKWGKDAKGRRSLLVEITKAVRKAVGPSKVVAVKVNCRDFREGGLEEVDALEAVKAVHATGCLDLVEVSGGTYERWAMFEGNADQKSNELNFLPFAQRVREQCAGLAVMVTGGFRTPENISSAITSGFCDIVGLCRPLCLCPELPRMWTDPVFAKSDLAIACKDKNFDVRISTPVLQSILGPGLSVFWHQRQLVRIACGKPVEPVPYKSVLLTFLTTGVVRAYIWEPQRSGFGCAALTIAAFAATVGVMHQLR